MPLCLHAVRVSGGVKGYPAGAANEGVELPVDKTERKISKIDRTARRFTARALRDTGLGLSEYEFIHCVRHHPGINQAAVSGALDIDKAAAARLAASLSRKGYIRTEPDRRDRRSKLLFATAKAEAIKTSKTQVEAFYYEWLTEDIPEEELERFLETLDKLYWKAKKERRAEFRDSLRLAAASGVIREEPAASAQEPAASTAPKGGDPHD